MSEPAFYRIDYSLVPTQERPALRRRMRDLGVLVPVERCEHGNIDPHITFINEHGSVTVLKKRCPGAGIGGDDGVDYETHTLMQGGIGGSDGR